MEKPKTCKKSAFWVAINTPTTTTENIKKLKPEIDKMSRDALSDTNELMRCFEKQIERGKHFIKL